MANQILYGFHNLKDLFLQRVTTVGVTEVNTAIDTTLAEWSRKMGALTDLFVTPTKEISLLYTSMSAGRLQPLSDTGRALPTKQAARYTAGYPIQNGGAAFGADFVTLVKMTVGEINDWLNVKLVEDMKWMRDHILGAIYNNVDWTYKDPLYGDLVVKPLANGDTVTYQIQTGTDSSSTAQHFLAQAAAIADATNPYPTIHDTLLARPENGGQVIAFIPTGLRATTAALATFFERADPNITLGSGASQLTGTLGVPLPGTLIGYESSGVWIVEWPEMPAGYIVALTTDGERPLKMREHPEPELQGFRRIAERNDFPWYESQYVRRAGFGAWNRVGALAYRIGNASYAVPAGYTAPMA